MAIPTDYYEVLGIPRDARPEEITHAYNRWVGEFKKESTPPDRRRESMLQDAFEVLSDPQRRKAHDAELAELRTPRKKGKAPVAAIAGGVAVVLAAGGGYFALGSGERAKAGKAGKAKSAEQLQLALSGSVSRIVAYDISGKGTPAGMAFVIEDKVMVANCHSLPPGVQLMVQTGTREVGARIVAADEALGLCKLLTDGYVGEPLAVSSALPAAGSKVYAGSFGALGEVSLKETAVGKVMDEPGRQAIQAPGAAQAGGNGAPLLDAQGRVVAVATLQPDGTMVHRVVPTQWLAENRPRVQEPRPYQGGGTPSATASAGSGVSGGSGGTSAGGGAGAFSYAPPLADTDYGCDCDITADPRFVAERDAKWKAISELPPAEREKAARLQHVAEEYTRKAMKDTNERLRRSGVD